MTSTCYKAGWREGEGGRTENRARELELEPVHKAQEHRFANPEDTRGYLRVLQRHSAPAAALHLPHIIAITPPRAYHRSCTASRTLEELAPSQIELEAHRWWREDGAERRASQHVVLPRTQCRYTASQSCLAHDQVGVVVASRPLLHCRRQHKRPLAKFLPCLSHIARVEKRMTSASARRGAA